MADTKLFTPTPCLQCAHMHSLQPHSTQPSNYYRQLNQTESNRQPERYCALKEVNRKVKTQNAAGSTSEKAKPQDKDAMARHAHFPKGQAQFRTIL